MRFHEIYEGKFTDYAKAAAIGAATMFGSPAASEVPSTTAPSTSIRPAERPLALNITNTENERVLMQMLHRAGIVGDEWAAFMAQAAHETMMFTRLSEMGTDFSKYDIATNPKLAKDLGNTQRGDGEKFHGRGFLHLTGRWWYTKFSQKYNIDLVNNPELLETNPKIAAATALYYWKTRVRPNVQDFTDVEKVTRLVNGGTNGLKHRAELFKAYQLRSQNLQSFLDNAK